jgi:hypothetical protein
MNTETIMKRLGIALGATVVLMALSGCATDGYYGAGYGYNGGYGYNRGNGYNGGYGYGYGQSYGRGYGGNYRGYDRDQDRDDYDRRDNDYRR